MQYSRLAALYDALVTDASDVPFFLECARRADGPAAEFMSGTGRVAVPLIEAGIDLTCIDASPQMLDVLRAKLRAKGLEARVVCSDVASVRLPFRYDFIFIAFHSFEELISDEARKDCLTTVCRHLTPGGLFACTLHDVARRLEGVSGEAPAGGAPLHRFEEPGSGRQVLLAMDTHHDPETGVVEGTESFTYADDTVPFLEVPVRFRLTDVAAFRNLAADAGFEVEAVLDGYSAAEYRPGESKTAVWMLRRAKR